MKRIDQRILFWLMVSLRGLCLLSGAVSGFLAFVSVGDSEVWAADTSRAVRFYTGCFGATQVSQNPHITELAGAGGLISIHGGGEGNKTWTGLTFQVGDVVAGAQEVVAAGGTCAREPKPENGEPPHLDMCQDPEGNQFMPKSRSRALQGLGLSPKGKMVLSWLKRWRG